MTELAEISTAIALDRLLQQARNEQVLKCDTMVWDYSTHFNHLWQLDALPSDKHAIVVWADTPDDPVVRPVATSVHLTPFDWALAARAKHPTIAVTVVDLRRAKHDAAAYSAVQWYRTQRPECVTWLRRVAAQDLAATRSVADTTKLLVPTEQNIARGIAIQDQTATGIPPRIEPRQVLRSLPACQIDLSSTETHHAIANLVGPLLLLPGSPQRSTSRATLPNHSEALRQVLIAAGLIPMSRGHSDRLDVDPYTFVRFILVDDQWHHGWAEWLAACIGAPWDADVAEKGESAALDRPQCVARTESGCGSLWVASSPEWLVDRLRMTLAAEKQKERRDARFGLRLIEDEAVPDAAEVLLLDLRLVPEGSEREHSLLKGVLVEAEKFTDYGAWPRFSAEETKALREWAERPAATPSRPTILTLLPRLVAQIDPSLPLILFSSTGRRDIVERLKGYDSIISYFSKPQYVSGQSTEIGRRAHGTLRTALRAAHDLLAARNLCRRVGGAEVSTPSLDASMNSHVLGGAAEKRIEVYIEESGAGQWMQVGGLIASYADEKAASEFSRTMRANQFVWGHDCDSEPGHVPRQRQKKASEIGATRTIVERLAKVDAMAAGVVRLSAFLVRGTRELAGRDVLSPGSPDHIYRSLVRQVLECILFLWPDIRANRSAEIAIYVATRLRYCRNRADYQMLRDRWGIDYKDYGAYVFGFDDVYPVITELKEAWPADGWRPNIVVAKGVGFRYYPQPSNIDRPKLPRQLHYVADWIASSPSSVPDAWWGRGFRDVSDGCFEAVIDAGRLAERRSHIRALSTWCAAGSALGPRCLPISVGRWVRERMADSAAGMEGRDVRELGDAIRARHARNLPSKVMVTGLLQEHGRRAVEDAVVNVLERKGGRVVRCGVAEAKRSREGGPPEFTVYATLGEHDHARATVLLAHGEEVLGRRISVTFA